MGGTMAPKTSTNRLISRLSSQDLAFLAPNLEAVDLPRRRRIEPRNKTIEHIYFIESGFASVVANGVGDREVEIGLIGREGMSGLASLMVADSSPLDTYMQMAGHGLRIHAKALREALGHRPSLYRAFLRYGHAFVIQTAYTALANARCRVEERLGRWLLMAHDRIDGDEVAITHEFLGIMLGVRRPGVTVALNLLERHGLIKSARGLVSIVDRDGLIATANGSYGAPEAEFQRLFG